MSTLIGPMKTDNFFPFRGLINFFKELLFTLHFFLRKSDPVVQNIHTALPSIIKSHYDIMSSQRNNTKRR